MSDMLFQAIDEGAATISECGAYRYDLTRIWARFPFEYRRVLFVMLNPSKADATRSDHTMTKCVNFAKSWGYGALTIVNLFAYRSTDPEELKRAADPVGPENDDYIRRWAGYADLTLCGWGAHPFAARRIDHVLGLLREAGVTPHCLKLTKDGHPGHPLMLPYSLKPAPMEISG